MRTRCLPVPSSLRKRRRLTTAPRDDKSAHVSLWLSIDVEAGAESLGFIADICTHTHVHMYTFLQSDKTMPATKDTTSVRITRATHGKLQEMAEADGVSLTDELDRIIEEQRRRRLFDEADRAYTALQEDEEARAEARQERQELEGSLADRLEDLNE